MSGSGTLGAALTLGITDFTTSARGAVPTPGGTSTGRFLKDDGTWAPPPSGVSGASGVFPFTYNTSTAESITGSQMRGNNGTFANSTKLWVSETTVDGLDVTLGLSRIKAGFQVYVQDYTSSASRYVLFNVTADATDKGNYWEITVAAASSLGTIPGGKVALQSISSAAAGNIFSTTTTAPGVVPGSNGVGSTYFLNGAGGWTVPAGGGGGGITTDQAIDAVQAAMSATAPVVVTQDSPTQTIKYSLSGTLAQFNTAITDGDIQPLDADLTTIAGLTATTNNILQSVSSAWASRTPTQVTATLDAVLYDCDDQGPGAWVEQRWGDGVPQRHRGMDSAVLHARCWHDHPGDASEHRLR